MPGIASAYLRLLRKQGVFGFFLAVPPSGGGSGSSGGGGGTVGTVPNAIVAVGLTPTPLYQPPPSSLSQAASLSWVLQVAQVADGAQSGKLRATLDFTLTENVSSTTVTDARIGGASVLIPQPLSANAATELAAGTMYVTSQTNGEAVFAHANNAQTDRNFRLLIIG